MKLSEIKITPILESIKLLDISDKEYFGSNYANYISNSRLNLLKCNDSPEKFFEGLQLNSQYSDSLAFGSACHELVLQPESFMLVEEINRPTAKAGLMADELYRPDGHVPSYEAIRKASQKLDYYKSSMNSDKADALKSKCNEYWRSRAIYESKHKDESKSLIYLPDKDKIRLKSCLDSINNNKQIQALLNPTSIVTPPKVMNEVTLLMDVLVEAPNNKPFILKLKSKLDNAVIDFDSSTIIVNDLKTTGKVLSEFNSAIERFSYYREMAMYSWLLSLYVKTCCNFSNTTIKSNFLVVETIPNFYTKVVPMTKSLFSKGMKEFSHLLKLAAFYCCDGNGYEGFRETR